MTEAKTSLAPVSFKPSQQSIFAIECNPSKISVTNKGKRIIKRGPLKPNEMAIMYDWGTLQICTEGQQTSDIPMGEIWVSYRWKLSVPSLPPHGSASVALNTYGHQIGVDFNLLSGYNPLSSFQYNTLPVEVDLTARTLSFLSSGIYMISGYVNVSSTTTSLIPSMWSLSSDIKLRDFAVQGSSPVSTQSTYGFSSGVFMKYMVTSVIQVFPGSVITFFTNPLSGWTAATTVDVSLQVTACPDPSESLKLTQRQLLAFRRQQQMASLAIKMQLLQDRLSPQDKIQFDAVDLECVPTIIRPLDEEHKNPFLAASTDQELLTLKQILDIEKGGNCLSNGTAVAEFKEAADLIAKTQNPFNGIKNFHDLTILLNHMGGLDAIKGTSLHDKYIACMSELLVADKTANNSSGNTNSQM
jgi:hypothetical protein